MRLIGLAVVLILSLTLAPLAAEAQQAANQVRRIGVLMHNAQNDPEAKAELAAFRQGLQQLGWSEGRNIRIDIRFAADRPDQYEVLAKQLIALQPDASRPSPPRQIVACSSCRVARPACTATSLLHSRRSIACHRSIRSGSTLLPVVSSPTVPTLWISPDRQRRMSIAFCVEPAPPNSRCRHQQST
jgi:hypothetical protein